MKVCHVIESFAGGSLYVLRDLAKCQVEWGWDVFVIHSFRDNTPKDYQKLFDSRVKLIPVKMVRNISPLNDITSLFSLLKIVRKIRPDILHLHSSKAGFLGRIVAGAFRLSSVYSPHGISFIQKNVSSFRQRFYYSLECLAQLIGSSVLVACSETECEELKNLPAPKAVFIPNAVNVKDLTPKVDYRIREKPLIGTCGYVYPAKDPIGFVSVVNVLRRSFPDISVQWIGDGPMKDVLITEQIEVSGWLSRSEVLSRLLQFDVYVQVSLWEGMPLSLLEAQGIGIPAVVLNRPGLRDVVQHEKTGFVATTRKEMVEYIKLLLQDERLRERMGREARRQIEKEFSLDAFCKNWFSLYQEVAKGGF